MSYDKYNRMKGHALLFGLNYAGTPNEFKGSINDAHNMAAYLQKSLGIPTEVITDDAGDASAPGATSMGMVRKLYELALRSHLESLDFVWIHYSGRGAAIVDTSGDEADGRDECLVPSDFVTGGLLPDDVIEVLFRSFNPNTRVIAVFDCAFSGTMGDLMYSWESQRKVAVENIMSEVTAKILTLSGCMDDQMTVQFGASTKDTQGALTASLLLALNQGCCTDVFSVLASVRVILKNSGLPQVPKLCSSYNLAHDFTFIPADILAAAKAAQAAKDAAAAQAAKDAAAAQAAKDAAAQAAHDAAAAAKDEKHGK